MTDAALQQKRLTAAAIDILVCLGIGVAFWVMALVMSFALGMASSTVASYGGRVFNLIGSLVMLGYILGRDVLFDGRSLGKKTQELRVVGSSGGAVTLEQSVRRNALFAVGSALTTLSMLFQLFPCVGDAVACLLMPLLLVGVLAAFAAAIVEIVMIIQDPAGIRIGDKFARTRVVRA
jgi:uncharacterized RDD family membrane protein YckC